MPAYKSLWGGERGGLEGRGRGFLQKAPPSPLQVFSSFPSLHPVPPHQLREAAGDFKVGGIVDVEKGQGFRARDRKSTRLNSSHCLLSRMPSSA